MKVVTLDVNFIQSCGLTHLVAYRSLMAE